MSDELALKQNGKLSGVEKSWLTLVFKPPPPPRNHLGG